MEEQKNMSNITDDVLDNIFYQARCKASTYNEQLRSREGAAEMMLINPGRLYRIEKGSMIPYPDEIHLMADLYNAPELENYYCTEMCPLGCEMQKVEIADLDRISIKAISTFRKVKETQELLLDVTEDGMVDETEKPEIQKVLENLKELEQVTQNLKLWVRKNL